MVGGGRSEPLVGGDGAPPGKNMKDAATPGKDRCCYSILCSCDGVKDSG